MRGEKELFPPYCRAEMEACGHVYAAGPKPPGRYKWGPLPEVTSHGPCSPLTTGSLVLCGHRFSSIKEFLQVKINHFSGKLFVTLTTFLLQFTTQLHELLCNWKGKEGLWAAGRRSRSLSWESTLGCTTGSLYQLVVCVEQHRGVSLKSNSSSDFPWKKCSEPIWLFKGHVKRFSQCMQLT